jgi:hypothetical protein
MDRGRELIMSDPLNLFVPGKMKQFNHGGLLAGKAYLIMITNFENEFC